MDSSGCYHSTNSPVLHFDSRSDWASTQSAAGDGSQAEIITMDSSVYKAAAKGNVHGLRQLPESDLLEQLSPKYNSVLHIAAQFGQLDTVRWMLESPWSVSLLQQKNLKGDTPLHLAAREGHLPVVEAICEAAKSLPLDIESEISAEKAMLRSTNNEGDTALHEAVRYNHYKMVKFLIMEDPDLFAYTENISGGTPLYMAAQGGSRELVEVIIDNSSSSTPYSGFYGRTALHAAVIQNDTEMTKMILEWKPKLTKEVDEHGWSPLHYAAYMGQATIVRALLKKSDKCVPHLRSRDCHLTALHIAAAHRRWNIVEILAAHSPDCCEEVDDKGNNVFHLAMMSGQVFASRDLLKNTWMTSTGLINEKNGEGNTPLHLLSSGYVYDPAFVRKENVDRMAFNNQKLTAVDLFLLDHHTCTCKDYLVAFLGEKGVLPCIGPKEWFRYQNNDNINSSQSNDEGNNNDGGCKTQEQNVGLIKRRGETHLIVATLVATVAFAAGFTLPGGYNQSNGMAMLSKKAAFITFLVTDAVAMVLSVSAVFNYLFMSLQERRALLDRHVLKGFFLTMTAVAAMVVAFMTGLYAVLPPSSGITNIFICFFFFLFFCVTCHKFLRKAIVGFHFMKHLPAFAFFW